MTVYSGQTISFSEAFAVPANGDNYTSSLSCVDGQAPRRDLTIGALDRSGTLVVGSSPVNVTCTFTNTLKQGGVIVQKVWVNGRAGDAAALSASIGAGTPVQDTSVAPAAPVVNPGDETLDNVVFIPAFAGDTVNFSESLGAAAGLYTTAWSCTNQAATSGTGTSGAVTITPADAGQNPVVCTITNTRKTATLQLTKDWGSSPATADEVKLDIGTSGSLDTANNGVDGTPNGTGLRRRARRRDATRSPRRSRPVTPPTTTRRGRATAPPTRAARACPARSRSPPPTPAAPSPASSSTRARR